MDYENFTLFNTEEFTDSSHGMTAKSTKSKRKADIPKDENWEVTNQQTRHGEAIALLHGCDRPSNAQTH